MSVSQNRYAPQHRQRLPRKGHAKAIQGDLEDSGLYYHCRVCGFTCNELKNQIVESDTQDYKDGGKVYIPYTIDPLYVIGEFDGTEPDLYLPDGWTGGSLNSTPGEYVGVPSLKMTAPTSCVEQAYRYTTDNANFTFPQVWTKNVYISGLFYVDDATHFQSLSLLIYDDVTDIYETITTANTGWNQATFLLSGMQEGFPWFSTKLSAIGRFEFWVWANALGPVNVSLNKWYVYEAPITRYDPVAVSGCPLCGSTRWK